MSPDCSNGRRTLELVRGLVRGASTAVEVRTILVESPADAVRLGFPGSPTVRVDGVDVEPSPPTRVGLG